MLFFFAFVYVRFSHVFISLFFSRISFSLDTEEDEDVLTEDGEEEKEVVAVQKLEANCKAKWEKAWSCAKVGIQMKKMLNRTTQ